MNKDSRETYYLLKEGKDFKKRLFIQASFPNEKVHPNDFGFVLDELKSLSGITKEEKK